MFGRLVIWVVIAHLVGCSGASRPIKPSASTFDGQVGGCSSFSVHRFDKAKKLAVYVAVDDTTLDLSNGPVTLAVATVPNRPFVQVLQFAKPAESYFCDDVGGDPEPIDTWNAVSGSVIVQKETATRPTAPSMYMVSVTLRNVVLTCVETGETATIDVLEIKDVWVGWLPG